MISDDGKTIFFRMKIEAPVSFVYSLWSEAENIPKWWAPTVSAVQMDFRESGSFRVVWAGSDERKGQPHGIFTKIDPLREIGMTWHWDSISPLFNSNIRMSFREVAKATQFEFVHENFSILSEVVPHHEAWEEIMAMLSSYSCQQNR